MCLEFLNGVCPFINGDIHDCYFDYEQSVLLRCWLSRISTIRSIASQEIKLGLLWEAKVISPSIRKSDNRVISDWDSQMSY